MNMNLCLEYQSEKIFIQFLMVLFHIFYYKLNFLKYLNHLCQYVFSRSVIKRPTDSTTSTMSRQTYTASGQMSTMRGQTNGLTSTTSGQTNSTSEKSSNTSG